MRALRLRTYNSTELPEASLKLTQKPFFYVQHRCPPLNNCPPPRQDRSAWQACQPRQPITDCGDIASAFVNQPLRRCQKCLLPGLAGLCRTSRAG